MTLLPLDISLVAIVLGWVIIFWLARRRTHRIERANPPIGKVLTHKGHNFHVYIRGQGPDLVLIHGSSGNLKDFAITLIDELAKSFRVIAVDRPGLGYTDALPDNEYRLIDQAEFIREGLAQIGVIKPIVMGHSLGGAVALAWATQHPETVRALVLLSAVTTPWPGQTRITHRIHQMPIVRDFVANFVAVVANNFAISKNIEAVFRPDPAPKNFRKNMSADLVLRPKSAIANARHRLNIVEQIRELARSYPTLAMPIHAISGDSDPVVPSELHITALEKTIPHVKIHMIPGAGHMPHHFHAPLIIKTVKQAHQDAMVAEKAVQ